MKINALVFSKNAPRLNNLLTKINPDYAIGMLSLQEVTPELAIQMSDKIDNGEFIVITADRTSVTNHYRSLKTSFLGEDALIPQGAFILASLLKCPAYFMVCPKVSDNKFEFVFEDFEQNGVVLNRKNRQQDLDKYALKYSDRLEKYCKLYPQQWFNFFDFWHNGSSK